MDTLRAQWRLGAVMAFAALAWSCGGGGGGGGGSSGGAPPAPETDAIAGHVIDGWVQNALVCADLDGNGRCDGSDPQARSDASGAFVVNVPRGANPPLLAEMTAGEARDGGATVDAAFRMSSPSASYSKDITPYTTLVHLYGDADALAEDLARTALGVPPYFDLHLAAPAAEGSRTQAVARGIVAALKHATPASFAARTPLEAVLAALPASLVDLPRLQIATKDAAPIVSREDYLQATFTLDDPAAQTGTVELAGKIRGRGHSTWLGDKKPYKIQIAKDDPGLARMADVAGMRKNRNWVLLADYFDRTLVRNKLAYSLGMSSVFRDGLRWGPSGQHVEVWLNGDYIGVYLLCEDIRIAPERVNVKVMGAQDVDGGYIVEVDWRLDCYSNTSWLDLRHTTPRGVPVCVSKPDEESITYAQLGYIKGALDQAETGIFDAGSTERIDMASFADWYLLNELFRNDDSAFHSSVYLWKDSDGAANPADRRLHLGPLWDYDLSAGNIYFNDNWKTEGCWISKSPYAPSWLTPLLANPQFLKLALERWKAKRPALERFVTAGLDNYKRRLQGPQARNFTRWPILSLALTAHDWFDTYDGHYDFLRHYLLERMAWLDKAYANEASFNTLCK